MPDTGGLDDLLDDLEVKARLGIGLALELGISLAKV
jgi:hypothetical protein